MNVSLFHIVPLFQDPSHTQTHTSPWAWPDSATTSYAPGAAVHLSVDVFWSWKLLFSVGKTGCHLHHPPVITINIIEYIGGMVTIPGHGWFIFVSTTLVVLSGTNENKEFITRRTCCCALWVPVTSSPHNRWIFWPWAGPLQMGSILVKTSGMLQLWVFLG